MNGRRGFTLIELIVALSLLATILPLAGGTVYLLLRAQTASADSLADAMILSRFANKFHADVHAAQSAYLDSDGSRIERPLVFKLEPRRTIMYAEGPDGAIVRTVRNDRGIERREEFRLAGTRTRFELSADRSTVTAVHKPRAVAASKTTAVAGQLSAIRIEAVIGRDHRFARTRAPAPTEPSPPALPQKPHEKGQR
jgi:prepilin-type N-terminal cleavage/methylation domain-containing protein